MTHQVLESITDLSTSLMKADGMASSEKDAGFCSGGDEDDMSGFHSPSASEDSVEVQITPISLKNKRKLAEPRKVLEPSTAPLKKRRFERIEVEIARDEEPTRTLRSPSPFRPWSCSNKSIDSKLSSSSSTSSASSSIATEGNIVERAGMFCTLGDASLPVTSIAAKKRVNQAEDSDNVPEDDHDRRRESEDTEARGDVEESRRTRKESQSRQHLPPRLRYATQTRSPRIEKRENPRQKVEPAKLSGPVTTTIAETTSSSTSTTSVIQSATTHQRLQEEPLSLVLRGDVASRVPSHPAVNGSYEKPCTYPVERPNVSSASLSTSLLSSSSSSSLSSLSSLSSSSSSSSSSCSSSSSSLLSFHRPPNHRTDTSSSSGIGGGGGGGGGSSSSSSSSSSSNGTSFSTAMSTTATITTTTANTTTATTNVQTGHPRQQHQQPVTGQQRNYKNMTRERRIEANARERTRVHTISAAFDTLRRAIPAYSHNQKLSKLSVLRIACSYIMTLGKIVNTGDEKETANDGGASLRACVDLVSRTIQTEGKLRKRKED